MKHNSKNIITDRDITMTGEGFQGEELSGVLTEHNDRLNTLESNIKWIYKNGGVGSGSGGGGGDDGSNWYFILIRKDTGESISDNSILYFQTPGTYDFEVVIKKPGLNYFSINYNSASAGSGKGTAKPDNEFTVRFKLNLTVNGTITFSVENQTTKDIIFYNIQYIVTPYKFNIKFVYSDTKREYELSSTQDIFMSELVGTEPKRGLLMALEYDIAVDITEMNYSFLNWDSGEFIDSSTLGEDYQVSNPSGTIYLPLVIEEDIIEYLQTNSNAGTKRFILNINLKLAGKTTYENIDSLTKTINLIPTNLFLNITTNAGSLFNETQGTGIDIETNNVIYSYNDSDKFPKGSTRFNVTPYFGSRVNNRTFKLDVFYDDDETAIIEDLEIRDQIETPINITLADSGEHSLKFVLKYGAIQPFEKTFFFYVRESVVIFNWFGDKSPEGGHNSYYRHLYGLSNFDLAITDKNKLIQQTTASPSITPYSFRISNVTTMNNYDQLCCIGFQYSSINDKNIPICSINLSNGDSYVVYQDRIFFDSGNPTTIFIPMTDHLDDSISDNYHLLSIYEGFIRASNNNVYRGQYVYLDGVLEAANKSFITTTTQITGISVHNCNCLINLMELALFKTVSEPAFLTDNDILKYYYSYRQDVLNDDLLDLRTEDNRNLFKAFDAFSLDSDNFVNTTSTEIGTIATYSKVPTLLISYTDSNGRILPSDGEHYGHDNLKDWINIVYDENRDEPIAIPITISWANGSGSNHSTLTRINDEYGSPAIFRLTPQGSSTLGYRCKNFELMAPLSESGDDDHYYVFSPNFDQDDITTFLPEESFTLKADVVDSSHSNNNSIGSFVNEVSTAFSMARHVQEQESGSTNPYKNHIKNCLSGFPILVFLESKYFSIKPVLDAQEPDMVNYYFLGIYNFNLGRNSFFNLGYRDTKKLGNLLSNGEFNLYKINKDSKAFLNGLEVAEIQGNSSYFDFSQFDPSILFYDNSSGLKSYMFGDRVSGNEETAWKDNIQTLVRKIAYAGGYVFREIGKEFSTSSDDNYGYADSYSKAEEVNDQIIEYVPNFRYQAYVDRNLNKIAFREPISDTVGLGNLNELLIGDTRDNEYGPSLDFTSLGEYYTICMAFGLVDSVQKNLNIKTWDSTPNSETGHPLWYLAFYDMDTCLGVSNQGDDISYFAFSDYWESVLDNDGTLKSCKVYKDYKPKSTDSTDTVGYFDIPSSYLFAIAKYAFGIYRITGGADLDVTHIKESHPNNLWAKWRQPNGCLENAKHFMDTYFTHHLDNVPISAFNYNYKYKYFIKETENFDDRNFLKFKGRRIHRTENWLKGRLHILDAYFNIPDLSGTLNGTDYRIPFPDSEYINSGNEDIIILRDIFSSEAGGKQYASLNSDVVFTSSPYSPIIIQDTNDNSPVNRYITPSERTACKIHPSTSGSQFLVIGGSQVWETLNSINPFISSSNGGSLYINSEYLTEITGGGTSSSIQPCSNWTLYTPSVKTISLTSNKFSGKITLNGNSNIINYSNLNSIDIHNSRISLEIDSLKVFSKLNISSMTGGTADIQILNCKLSSVTLTNSSLKRLKIPAWNSKISLPTSFKCKELDITNKDYKGSDSYLTITDNSELTTLTISGFEKITVNNCKKLEKIILGDNTIKTLIIYFSSKSDRPSSFTVGQEGGFSNNVVDLSSLTNLENIQIINSPSERIILPDRTVTLYHSSNFEVNAHDERGALEGNDNLEYLDGNGPYYITGGRTFCNCKNYNLKQSDGSFSKIKVHSNTTSLSDTFYITRTANSTDRGSITLESAKEFLNNCCNNASNVTDIKYLFYNQSISYPLERFKENYVNEECDLCFSNFKKCTNYSYALYENQICAYNRYMFKNASSQISENSGVTLKRLIGSQSWSQSVSGIKVIYATVDFLYEIIENLSSFTAIYSDDNSVGLCFRFLELSIDSQTEEIISTVIPTLEMKKIFSPVSNNVTKYPSKLWSIHEIEIHPDHTIDLLETFDTESNRKWTAAQLGGLYITSFLYRRSYSNITNLDYLFKNIPIKAIYQSLANFPTGGNRINMATFIDWDRLDKCQNLFYCITSGGLVYSSINFPKYITKSDFLSVWNKILIYFHPDSAYDGVNTGLAYLFKNCKIIGWNDEDEFYLSNTGRLVNTDITRLANLFHNCSFYENDQTTSPQYKSITSEFLAPLPKLTVLYEVFCGMRWKNTVPFNFFRARQEIITDVFVADPITGEKIPAKYYTYDYEHRILDLRRCFYNITLETGTGFDVNGEYNCEEFINNRTRIVDENNIDNYTVYYTDRNSSIPIPIKISSEESDCLNSSRGYSLEGNYTASVTIGSSSSCSLVNPSNVDSSHLFISPDVLYAINNNTIINNCLDGVFKFDDNIQSDPITFTGLIPEHLFKVRDDSSIDIFSGLNLVPRYLGQTTEEDNGNQVVHKHYCYLPKNFTSRKDISSLLNFKLMVPDNNSRTHYYLLRQDSIPDDVTNMSPTLVVLNRLYNGDRGNNYYPYSVDTGIRYHIMCNPVFENDSLVSIEEGISLEHFNKLKLDNFIDSKLASFISGRVFIESIGDNWSTWKDEVMSLTTSYVISIGNSSFGGLHYACKLNFPYTNDQFAYGVGTQANGNYVNIASIDGGIDGIDRSSYQDKRIRFTS